MEKEIVWRNIPEFPDYAISEDGSIVKRVSSNRILRPGINNGYLEVRIVLEAGNTKKRFVHHLSLYADGRPRVIGLQCDHKNGNREDNRPENLEWVTPSENRQRAVARKAARLAAEALEMVKEGF